MKQLTKILLLILLLQCLTACIQKTKQEGSPQMQMLTQAPNFKLLDQDSQEQQLSDYSDQYVLIYFYPKDDTPGCTAEACKIRDQYNEFETRGIKVFGISPDSPKSHKKFIEKYKLPFTLLSDPGKKIAKLYNADGIFVKRISYLISPEGKVVKFYPKVNPTEHAQEILEDFDRTQKE